MKTVKIKPRLMWGVITKLGCPIAVRLTKPLAEDVCPGDYTVRRVLVTKPPKRRDRHAKR